MRRFGLIAILALLCGALAAEAANENLVKRSQLFGDNVSLLFGDGAAGTGGGDVEIRWDATDLDILAAANNNIIKFGNGTNSFDIWLYGSAAANYVIWDASGNDLIFQDNVSAIFGTGSDVEVRWDATDLDVLAAADDSVINFGTGTNSFDLKVFGETSGDYVYFDASANLLYTTDVDLQVKDDDFVVFGNGAGAAGDVHVEWDTAATPDQLIIDCEADDTVITLGDGTTSFDLDLFGGSAAAYISFDASANDLKFEDSVSVMFGTGATAGRGTAGDVEIRWDGTDLDVLATADDSIFKFGNGTASFDLWVYGNAATEYVLWDASRDVLSLEGNAKLMRVNGVEWFDDFTAEVFDTNEYTVNSDAGGTPFAIVEAVGGTLAGAADNEVADKEEIAGSIQWSTSKVTVFEVRVKTDDITTNCFNIGLSDAKNEAATTVAWTVGASDAVTTNSDDGVGFAFDTRADTDGWFGVVSATTDDKEGAGATAPANGTYQTLRFEIDASRLVTFYIDGVAYGSQSTALDATTSLCLYIANQSTTTATRTWTIDYVYIWQDR